LPACGAGVGDTDTPFARDRRFEALRESLDEIVSFDDGPV
jgi:hypothetical protein